MSASKNSVLSFSRHCPLTALPAELSMKIFSLIDLEIEAFVNLLLVDRLFYNFMKSHEAVLVINVVQHQDPLAELLVLRSNPSYRAFFTLYKEQKIFRSIVDIVQREYEYEECFEVISNPRFSETSGCAHILRAGFLIHHRIASIENRQNKATYADELSHEPWALVSVFEYFLRSLLCLVADKRLVIFGELDSNKRESILFFIHEVSIFSSLKVVRDFIDLQRQPIELRKTTDLYKWAQAQHQPIKLRKTIDLYEWARTFESRYLASGVSVLSMDSKTRGKRLKLSSHLSLKITRNTHPCIHLPIPWPGNNKDRFPHDEILTLSNILPTNPDESELFNILEKLPVNKTCCRFTSIEETPGSPEDYSMWMCCRLCVTVRQFE